MNMLPNQPKLEEFARQLDKEEDYRVLRAVPNRFSHMPEDGVPPDGRCIAILDTETSGLNVHEDKLIELAIMLVWVDDDGSVTGHMGPVSWHRTGARDHVDHGPRQSPSGRQTD